MTQRLVVLPYTRLHPVTARLANTHAPGHVRVMLNPDDGTDPRPASGYWDLLAELWKLPGDLVVVEQDIGLRAGVIEGFDACRRPWCGHPYRVGSELVVALGCTRFTAELKAAQPDLLERVGQISEPGMPAKHWRRLDVRLADQLRRRGYRVHEHEPAVAHYHRYPA